MIDQHALLMMVQNKLQDIAQNLWKTLKCQAILLKTVKRMMISSIVFLLPVWKRMIDQHVPLMTVQLKLQDIAQNLWKTLKCQAILLKMI